MSKLIAFKSLLYALIIIVLAITAFKVNHQYNTRPKPDRLGKAPIGAKENDYVRVFTDIYSNKVWAIGSGPGSNPKNAREYIVFLQNLLNEPSLNTIVDLGCGDWQIMRTVQIPVGKKYKGYDVVASIIAENAEKYVKPNVQFYHITGLKDFVRQRVSGDLLIVKDVLHHLSNSEVEFFIVNILPSFKRVLLINDYSPMHTKHNDDIYTGTWRSLGLLEPPFNLKHAEVLFEYDGPEHKQVVMYQNPRYQY